MVYFRGTTVQPVVVDEVETSWDVFLYSKLSPAHCIGEKSKEPGPQILAPCSLSDASITTLLPCTAGLHTNWGSPTASVNWARQTFVCCPQTPSVATFSALAWICKHRRTAMATPFIVPDKPAAEKQFER